MSPKFKDGEVGELGELVQPTIRTAPSIRIGKNRKVRTLI